MIQRNSVTQKLSDLQRDKLKLTAKNSTEVISCDW